MKNKLSLGLLVLCVGAAAGCSDDPPVDTAPYCAASAGEICEPAGFPFLTEANFRSDACPGPDRTCATPASQTTVTLTEPTAGQLCMKGTVVSPAGFAWLILSVSHWNKSDTHIVDVLNARALGITGFQFTIDGPPVAGVNLFATTVHTRDCDVPGACLTGWNLMSGPRSNLVKVFDHSETVTAPFTDFSNNDPNATFDITQLGHFIFVVQPGAYDFCISDFRFLNAQGAEVLPDGTLGTDAGTDTDATTG